MDQNTELKLQAWLDDELSEAEATKVAALLERDEQAAALAAELRHTRDALAGFEAEVRVPESREFYWSKIEREIRRLDRPALEPDRVSYWVLLRRCLAPASAIAVVALTALVLLRPAAPPGLTRPAAFETASADAGTFTYHDYAAGATLVWLSYPADNDVADTAQNAIVR